MLVHRLSPGHREGVAGIHALAVAGLEPAADAARSNRASSSPGFTAAAGFPLDVVVAHRLRGVDGVGHLLLRRRLEEGHAVRILLLGHRADPRSREAVCLQLGAHGVAVRARAVVRVLLHDAGDVLHVVAVLVSQHVKLRERARGRVEPLPQQGEERRIDVDGLFRRAVEGAGLVGCGSALRRRRGVHDDELRAGGSPATCLAPVLVDREGCRSEPAVVAAVRIGAGLAVRDLGLAAAALPCRDEP